MQKKTYTVVISREEGGFVGECKELHAFSQGETYGQMMENIREAVELASESNQDEFEMLVIKR